MPSPAVLCTYYRDPHELELGVEKIRLLAEHGQRQEVLDPAGVARLDPVFARVTHKIKSRAYGVAPGRRAAERFQSRALAGWHRRRTGTQCPCPSSRSARSTWRPLSPMYRDTAVHVCKTSRRTR